MNQRDITVDDEDNEMNNDCNVVDEEEEVINTLQARQADQN